MGGVVRHDTTCTYNAAERLHKTVNKAVPLTVLGRIFCVSKGEITSECYTVYIFDGVKNKRDSFRIA